MKELTKGNEAIAKGAVAAGCRYYFGYPITPQSDIPEYLSAVLPKIGGEFLQGGDIHILVRDYSRIAFLALISLAQCARFIRCRRWRASLSGRHKGGGVQKVRS